MRQSDFDLKSILTENIKNVATINNIQLQGVAKVGQRMWSRAYSSPYMVPFDSKQGACVILLNACFSKPIFSTECMRGPQNRYQSALSYRKIKREDERTDFPQQLQRRHRYTLLLCPPQTMSKIRRERRLARRTSHQGHMPFHQM